MKHGKYVLGLNENGYRRLLDEHEKLEIKISKLKVFINSEEFKDVSEGEKVLLSQQLDGMKSYYRSLHKRVEIHQHIIDDEEKRDAERESELIDALRVIFKTQINNKPDGKLSSPGIHRGIVFRIDGEGVKIEVSGALFNTPKEGTPETKEPQCDIINDFLGDDKDGKCTCSNCR